MALVTIEKLDSMGTLKNHSRHLIGYMILSVTGFRREVGVLYYFITAIFCLIILGLCLSRKYFTKQCLE